MSDPRNEYLINLFSRSCGDDEARLEDWIRRFEQGYVPSGGEWRSVDQIRRMASRSKGKSRRHLFEVAALFVLFLGFDLLLGLFVGSLYR